MFSVQDRCTHSPETEDFLLERARILLQYLRGTLGQPFFLTIRKPMDKLDATPVADFSEWSKVRWQGVVEGIPTVRIISTVTIVAEKSLSYKFSSDRTFSISTFLKPTSSYISINHMTQLKVEIDIAAVVNSQLQYIYCASNNTESLLIMSYVHLIFIHLLHTYNIVYASDRIYIVPHFPHSEFVQYVSYKIFKWQWSI